MKTQQNNIATLNDTFRKNSPAQYVFTLCVIERIPLQDILFAVRHYDTFTEANDPYSEHDFGSLSLNGEKIFWKIDYYDQALTGWCDPLTSECRRVLTVMLAEEY